MSTPMSGDDGIVMSFNHLLDSSTWYNNFVIPPKSVVLVPVDGDHFPSFGVEVFVEDVRVLLVVRQPVVVVQRYGSNQPFVGIELIRRFTWD